MKILALDIASQTGWCSPNAHGCWDLRIKRDESGGLRLLRLKAKVKEIIELEQIELVVYERVSGFHKNAIIVASEMVGVVKSFCDENNIPYKAYSAAEIKRFATGKGNASKKQMIQAAKDKHGYSGDDDNVADAIHLYHIAKNDLGID